MMTVWDEWERCRPWIEAALEYSHNTHTIADVELGILHNRYSFWPGLKSAMVTEVHQYPRVRFLHIAWAGGDMTELRQTVKLLLRPYCILIGCTRITLAGRRGWERALKSDGWQADLVCLGLPVETVHEQIATGHDDQHANKCDPRVADTGLEGGCSTGG